MALTVRNDTDIVEAYTFEPVGDCAAWTTVEPARVSLYPGTSGTVTVRLAPPRSPEVRAGEVPLGVRVVPVERPDAVTVPETTVVITAFQELRAELEPTTRRGWLGGRYRTTVRNLGNTATAVTLTGRQPGSDLRLTSAPGALHIAPGGSAAARLRVRARRPVWFGEPVTWPFEVEVARDPEGPRGSLAAPRPDAGPEPEETGERHALQGEFVQQVVFPRWLLLLLAALLALLVAWFLLVRPAVESTAKEAADDAARENVAAAGKGTPTGAPAPGTPGQDPRGTGTEQPGGGQGAQETQRNGGSTTAPAGSGVPGTGRQSSATVEVRTGDGARENGAYRVPEGKVFGITDIVVANFQGDEGLVTVTFGNRKITTIALETFRNQDYHWVTPIEVPEKQAVTVSVTCDEPGTPASGKPASGCVEVLNVSGVLSDIQR